MILKLLNKKRECVFSYELYKNFNDELVDKILFSKNGFYDFSALDQGLKDLREADYWEDGNYSLVKDIAVKHVNFIAKLNKLDFVVESNKVELDDNTMRFVNLLGYESVCRWDDILNMYTINLENHDRNNMNLEIIISNEGIRKDGVVAMESMLNTTHKAKTLIELIALFYKDLIDYHTEGLVDLKSISDGIDDLHKLKFGLKEVL